MEPRILKVLDSFSNKRKRAAHVTGVSCGKLQDKLPPNPQGQAPEKRRKLEGEDKVSSAYEKSKTGVAKRVMIYEEGEWKDLPHQVISAIRNELDEKRAAVEFEWSGHRFLLDFLHMHRLDLETGAKTPLAWIDIGGKCFFPEIYESAERHDCCNVENSKQFAPREIKLHLEIDVNGGESPRLILEERSDKSGDSMDDVPAEVEAVVSNWNETDAIAVSPLPGPPKDLIKML